MAPRVLISDKLSSTAVQIFKDRGLDVTFEPDLGKDKDRLLKMIPEFDGLAIRSATKVTEKILEAATNLKVVGRAGIGVDNVDVKAASSRGVIVMNTPFGNSITTAEHAISLMLALARQIPAANESTQAGKWEKSRFMGVELYGKTLGIIGCGNIGSIVADRGIGLRMKVIAFDPFLSPERAIEIGAEKVELLDLLTRSDFITLHTPLTDKTRNVLGEATLSRIKPGARIINCARGGLVDEQALANAIRDGRVAGAAFDVFEEEPATASPLFGLDNVICTPHLGAATSEAQENVAIQVADQMSDYLQTGAISNAINFPSITAEEAPKLKPFVKLAEQLGSFAGQLTETGIHKIKLEYAGEIAEMNVKALTSAALAGLLKPMLSESVNMVSAPTLVRDRGISVEEVRRGEEGAYQTYMRLTVTTERQERSVAGTVFSNGQPRLIQVKGINMEAELTEHMLYITNNDKPGFIGSLGQALGKADVNIATMNLGREAPGGDAICLVSIDGAITPAVIEQVNQLPNVVHVNELVFD